MRYTWARHSTQAIELWMRRERMELQAFIKRWEDNQIEMARFCGEVLATCPHFLDAFLVGFAEALFRQYEMGQRIEFLYDETRHGVEEEDQRVLCDRVEFKVVDGIVCLHDKEGAFGGLAVMLLKDLDPPESLEFAYSMRIYNSHPCSADGLCPLQSPGTFEEVSGKSDQKPERHVIEPKMEINKYNHVSRLEANFWNFRVDRQGKVNIYAPMADGFNCIRITRRLAHLVRWTTNIMGYQEKIPELDALVQSL